jgi:hypothetical protein
LEPLSRLKDAIDDTADDMLELTLDDIAVFAVTKFVEIKLDETFDGHEWAYSLLLADKKRTNYSKFTESLADYLA